MMYRIFQTLYAALLLWLVIMALAAAIELVMLDKETPVRVKQNILIKQVEYAENVFKNPDGTWKEYQDGK